MSEGLTPGFRGRARAVSDRLPPGQYPTEDFPVLSAGPTPHVPADRWTFTLTAASGDVRAWTWDEFTALPQEEPVADIHCVTRWSKFATRWRGVSLDTLFAQFAADAAYAMVECHGGYTTNLALEDLLDGRAWIVHSFDGFALSPEHGGPARLLVPHLYFWKSAKWVRGMRLMEADEPGFWEQLGYHTHGDPWREQRTWGD